MSSNNNQCLKAMNLVVGKRLIKTLHEESPTLVIVETGNQLNRWGVPIREKIDLSDKRQFAEIIEKHIRSGAQVWARRPIYDPCLGVCFEIDSVRKDEFGRESKLPSVNKVVKSLQSWLSEKYKGHVRATHLQEYLNEFEFWWRTKIEFTYDSSLSPTETSYQIFRKLLHLTVITEPMGFKTKKVRGSKTTEPIRPFGKIKISRLSLCHHLQTRLPTSRDKSLCSSAETFLMASTMSLRFVYLHLSA